MAYVDIASRSVHKFWQFRTDSGFGDHLKLGRSQYTIGQPDGVKQT